MYSKISRKPTQGKIRYKSEESPAMIVSMQTNEAIIQFDVAQRAITPGQAVVFYKDDVLVGGGVIDRSLDMVAAQ
jgi:Predicted tRNA(5-methylaminomethyl-2-thiouridylate) methyltransferase, contains the PP-loop ATPase domain